VNVNRSLSLQITFLLWSLSFRNPADLQPGVYRSIIGEVIGSLKADFDEFGIGDEVLDTLRQVSVFTLLGVVIEADSPPEMGGANGGISSC
jgi:hypothetical protein